MAAVDDAPHDAQNARDDETVVSDKDEKGVRKAEENNVPHVRLELAVAL